MCGIIGIIDKDAVSQKILDCLQMLEYRGYDSAGIVTVDNGFNVCRTTDKVVALKEMVLRSAIQGSLGIGHTRWATHGVPSIRNAHPIITGKIAVVHNGIIENYQALKNELIVYGYDFLSDTDTEVITILIQHNINQGMDEIQAIRASIARLHGAFALAIVFADNPDFLIGVKKGSPLVVGIGDEAHYLSSDTIALSLLTERIIYLEDNQLAILYKDKYLVQDFSGRPVSVKIENIPATDIVNKEGFSSFMLKEIYEQPQTLKQTFAYNNNVMIHDIDWTKVTSINIIACGSSLYAGKIAKYWIESIAKKRVEVNIASEFRSRPIIFEQSSVYIFISQSGETADTLNALKYAKENKVRTIGIVNVANSAIAKLVDYLIQTFVGPEIAVASTKAFTGQLMVLALLTIQIALCSKVIDVKQKEIFLQGLQSSIKQLPEILKLDSLIMEVAKEFIANAQRVLYVSRGSTYPLALEGALKIRELAYIAASGIAAGELKHGTIALVDSNTPVIVIAPYNHLFTKMASNVQEINARGGKIILLSDELGVKELKDLCAYTLVMQESDELTAPIMYTLPLQLLAYYTAKYKKCNVDKPRNLAKSVTVE